MFLSVDLTLNGILFYFWSFYFHSLIFPNDYCFILRVSNYLLPKLSQSSSNIYF